MEKTEYPNLNGYYINFQLLTQKLKEIAQEKEQAIAEIRNDISDIAILAASKVLEEDIDKSKHEDLIQKFIKEVGEAE